MGKVTRIAAALAFTLLCTSAAFATHAAHKKSSGTVVAISEEVADVKAKNGKVYKIKVEDIVAENLKTGDVVEYELVSGQPVHVKKKAPHTKKAH